MILGTRTDGLLASPDAFDLLSFVEGMLAAVLLAALAYLVRWLLRRVATKLPALTWLDEEGRPLLGAKGFPAELAALKLKLHNPGPEPRPVRLELRFAGREPWLMLDHTELQLGQESSSVVVVAFCRPVDKLLADTGTSILVCSLGGDGVPSQTIVLDLQQARRGRLRANPPALPAEVELPLDGRVDVTLDNPLCFAVRVEAFDVQGGDLELREPAVQAVLAPGDSARVTLAVRGELGGRPYEEARTELVCACAASGDDESVEVRRTVRLRPRPIAGFAAEETSAPAPSSSALFEWTAALELPRPPEGCLVRFTTLEWTRRDGSVGGDALDVSSWDGASQTELDHGDGLVVRLGPGKVTWVSSGPLMPDACPREVRLGLTLVDRTSQLAVRSSRVLPFDPPGFNGRDALALLLQRLEQTASPGAPHAKADVGAMVAGLKAAVSALAGEEDPQLGELLQALSETLLVPFGKELQRRYDFIPEEQRERPPPLFRAEVWHDLLRSFAAAWTAADPRVGPVRWPALGATLPGEDRLDHRLVATVRLRGSRQATQPRVYWVSRPTLQAGKELPLIISYL